MLTRQVRRLSMFLAMCAGIVDGILVKDEGPEPVLAQVRKVCSIIGISSEDAVAMENAVKLLIAHAPCGKVENVVDEKRAS
ncbi:MAG: hypothetical protein HDQ88_04410 [Clostridia bacterium]|nr:hypothetical protein [Clostridia bacterium]